jgi:hypothetical protein
MGEICHIKGRRRGALRYDPQQTPSARHSYQNLLLMCSTHHTLVDADAESFTVEVLRKMKARHEGKLRNAIPDLTEQAARLLHRRPVSSVNQHGGITADTVNITVHQATQPNSAGDDRFDALRRRVLYVGIRNNLPVELHALREFLVESDFVRRPAFRNFFEKWLTKAPVVIGWSGLNVFTSEEIVLLRQDLTALRA